jgi:uncharacterized membrane protein
MQGKATIAGHPIHPMLVTFPIGCYVAAAISDLVSLGNHSGFWQTMGMWLLAFGVGGSLLAAFFGFVDYLSAPMSADARTVANLHATLNVAILIIFGTAFAIEYLAPHDAWGYVLTAAGLVLLAIAGTLGGSLAHRHLVGSSEQDLATTRRAADETALSPSGRSTREREIARSAARGKTPV